MEVCNTDLRKAKELLIYSLISVGIKIIIYENFNFARLKSRNFLVSNSKFTFKLNFYFKINSETILYSKR